MSSVIISGCTPLSAVSMIGSTLSRTIEKEQQKKAEEPANLQIAVTNVRVGVEYMRQGYHEKALEKFNRAIEADPKYALTYNMLGVLYQLLEDPVAAENNFKKSLKLKEEDSSTLNNYGQFLCKQNRETEAEEYFLKAAGNPFYETPELAYANAGSCAYMHEQIDIAVKYFEKSLSINPAVAVALSQMAEIRFNAGDINMARDYMNRYLDVAKHSAKTLWLAIRIERHFGDVDKLASYFLLLRNQFADTKEAELLRISEGNIARVKQQKYELNASKEKSGEIARKQESSVKEISISSTVPGLLDDAELPFYPMLLEEAELLGIK